MSDFEERLPDCYSFGARGGPSFSTEVNKTQGGQAYANRNWVYPLHRFDITEGVKTQVDFERIRTFFYNVYGRADAFRFRHWTDYQATLQPLGLIAGVVYQLQRAYVRGVRTFVRPINKPVSGTVTVYRKRGAVTSTITPSIDYTTGQVTVSGHVSGDTYTWSGEFDVRVAFVNDYLEEEVIDKSPAHGFLVRWSSIQLEERRL